MAAFDSFFTGAAVAPPRECQQAGPRTHNGIDIFVLSGGCGFPACRSLRELIHILSSSGFFAEVP